MTYPINSFFNPSGRYKETWSLAPQVGSLSIANQKTKSLYNDLSSAIPLFYLLMLSAIGMDIYLGFSVLAKSGVSFALITGSIIADLFLAILPFILESFIAKSLNHVRIENEIFKIELESMTKRIKETDEEFNIRRTGLMTRDLPQLKSKKRVGKIIRWLIAIIIFLIATWKIFTFLSVLPPGISIFSTINGKIVIIFSLLCAIFHLIGSEKAFAHLMYMLQQKEFKNHQRMQTGNQPKPSEVPINFEGNYENATEGYTSVISGPEGVTLQFIHLIKDQEIKCLMDAQRDDKAKRGIAITAKQIQL